MKITFENRDKVELLTNLRAGDTFLRDGCIWLVINASVYDEELDEDNHIHVVRLSDGFMDGFSPNCRVTPINVEAIVKED